jgi:hypothetical protein
VVVDPEKRSPNASPFDALTAGPEAADPERCIPNIEGVDLPEPDPPPAPTPSAGDPAPYRGVEDPLGCGVESRANKSGFPYVGFAYFGGGGVGVDVEAELLAREAEARVGFFEVVVVVVVEDQRSANESLMIVDSAKFGAYVG